MMKKVANILLFSFLFLVILLLFFISSISADTITVGPGGEPLYDYSTISDAISNANVSDTINVYSGTYNEYLLINKELNLIGVSGSGSTIIITSSASQHTIEITSNNVKVSGFTIKNLGGSYACVLLTSVSNCQIENNVIEDGGNGLYVSSSDSNTLKDNTIYDNNAGIYLSNSDSNSIYLNNIQNNNANGVYLTAGSTSNNIYENTISSNNLFGVKILSSNSNTFYKNHFSDNGNSNANDAGTNNWDYNTNGNYWDDYNDYDVDPQDGKGDNPYPIPGSGGNQDNYPLGEFLSINQEPVAYIDSITPNPATVGDTISFRGHGTDDGSIISWRWRSNGNIISYSEDFEKSDFSSGTYTITFQVQDNDNEWSEYDSTTLIVNDQSYQKPFAFITKPNPDKHTTYVYGDPVEFNGYGVDNDGVIQAYNWRSEPVGVSSSLQSFTLTDIPVGDFTIYFAVRDNDGEWSSEVSTTLSITSNPSVQNEPPVANAGGPYSGYTNKSITFDGSNSYDSDTDDTITYFWNFGDDSTSEGESPKHTYTEEGTYTIELTVIDSHGESSVSTTVVEIYSGTGGNNGDNGSNGDGLGIPGFELIFTIIALIFVVLWKKNRI